MKNKSFITLLSVSLLAFSSCSDFLDTLPDSRTEINVVDAVFFNVYRREALAPRHTQLLFRC